MNIPSEYLLRMKELFGADASEWYDRPAFRGIRINLLKADESLLDMLPFETKPSPFAENGRYIDSGLEGIGADPFHHAGAFYVQEPSASCAVAALDPRPGERILDLCAAPGGKSGQIAERLKGDGLLISNEYVRGRVKPLSSNLERLGVRNSVITNCAADLLCERLAGYFDRVLVDAPCSGEGMMRKEAAARDGWSMDNIRLCAGRQKEILRNAAKSVRTGGVLVYSTCTFAPEENEEVISDFLKSGEFELTECGFGFSRSGLAQYGREMCKTVRVFPDDGGEGHFVAKMIRKSEAGSLREPYRRKDNAHADTLKRAQSLYEELTDEPIFGKTAVFGSTVRILPNEMPELSGINVVRAGVDLAEIKGKRLEPMHGFYMAAKPERVFNLLEMDTSDKRIAHFLNGQQIECGGKKGYCAAAVNGFIMGFGKCSDGVMKNHYPKGLRNLR
ncbi:MAG: RsmF rRNA methyltransferase first C-terminal domain-containing protein [Clostridia bacterium]|nr:RsmF rRNA methyltransferase first C-terminal domain-containing protein [Clostridia bacterium]